MGDPDVRNVYQFSRAIFRELRPYLATEEAQSAVLAASEDMVERLAYGTAPRRPARELFRTVPVHVGLESQLHVRLVIDRYLEFAQSVCVERRRRGLDAFGAPAVWGDHAQRDAVRAPPGRWHGLLPVASPPRADPGRLNPGPSADNRPGWPSGP